MRQFRDILILMKYVLFIILFSLNAFSKDLSCDEARKILSNAFQAHYSVNDVSPNLIEKAITHYVNRRDPNNLLITEEEFNIIKKDAKKHKKEYSQFLLSEKELSLRFDMGSYYIPQERCLFLSKAFNMLSNGRERYKNIYLKVKDENLSNTESLKLVENPSKRIKNSAKLESFLYKHLRYLKQNKDLKTVDFYLKEDRNEKFFEDTLNSILLVMDNHSGYLNTDYFKEFDSDFQRTRLGFGIVFPLLDSKKDNIRILKVIQESAASKTIIEKNDEVLEVNGKSVLENGYQEVIEEITKRSKINEPTVFKIRTFIDKETFPEVSDLVEISITPEEFSQEKIITKVVEKNDNIFFQIKLADFYDKSSSDLQEVYLKLKSENPHVNGIILDLRDNPGGSVDEVLKISNLFIGKKLVLQVDNKNKEENERIYSSSKMEYPSFFSFEEKPFISEKIIVLTNSHSASASEILAGILKSYNRALIVGDEHTFGKGSIQTLISYDKHGLGALKISRSVYYLADGKTPQFNGISSDIVLPSITSFSKHSEKKFDYTLKPKNKFSNLVHYDFKSHDKTMLKALIKKSKQRVKENKEFDVFSSEKEIQKYINSENFNIIDSSDPVMDETVNIFSDLLELSLDY